MKVSLILKIRGFYLKSINLILSKDWIDVLSSLLTPTVALIAVYIASRQWSTSENKRKQDLFDKRFNFYQRVWGVYSQPIENGGIVNFITDIDILEYVNEAQFLFGEEIVEHLFLIPDKQKENCVDYDWFSEPFKKYMQLK